ncbi:hypothetical protein [Devosia faecipullorum]|nr:hypothetical protein [Devosia faecipullorum]MBE7733140.1 hypothetical protein [Devosia faecipullorum]
MSNIAIRQLLVCFALWRLQGQGLMLSGRGIGKYDFSAMPLVLAGQSD